MVGILTIIEDAPAMIGDAAALITAIDKVWPDAVAAEQVILAAVKTPLEKIKTDVEGMQGGSIGAIVTDIQTFFTDLAALGTSLGTLISLVETKAEALWAELSAPIASIKSDISDLLPASTPAVTSSTAP